MTPKLISTLVFILFCSAVAAEIPHQRALGGLNELLRGQYAAVETYTQALEKLGVYTDAGPIFEALRDHKAATKATLQEIARLGGVPATSSGVWGTWAQAVTGGAKLLGSNAALKVLKEGEEHGIKEYEEVLQQGDVASTFKDQTLSTFLPNQKKHITELDRLMTPKAPLGLLRAVESSSFKSRNADAGSSFVLATTSARATAVRRLV
jgi:hypothetical protein